MQIIANIGDMHDVLSILNYKVKFEYSNIRFIARVFIFATTDSLDEDEDVTRM